MGSGADFCGALALPCISQPEVVIEALPAVGAAQLDAAELGQDAAADGGQAGPGGGPGSGGLPVLFPPEPQMLQEREGELAQEPVVVQATPAPALEMVEAQLVLHLLVHLLQTQRLLIRAARTSSGVLAG